jgi:hypothetical protein
MARLKPLSFRGHSLLSRFFDLLRQGGINTLCTYHHRLVHEGGYLMERDEHGLRFVARAADTLPERSHT